MPSNGFHARIWMPGAAVSRARDRLFWAHREFAADGGWVAGSEQPATAAEVIEVQVAPFGEHRERGGAGGVGESDDAIAGCAAGAVDHGAATRPGQLELGMAEVACRYACRGTACSSAAFFRNLAPMEQLRDLALHIVSVRDLNHANGHAIAS